MERYGEGFRKPKKLTTSTGMSINDIALQLMERDPTKSLSFKEAMKDAKPIYKERKEKKKEIDKARDVLDHGGGPIKRQIFKKLFGENLGTKLAKITVSSGAKEEAARTLIDSKSTKTPEKVQAQKLDTILKKIKEVSIEVKEIKAMKVEAPVAVPVREAPIASGGTPETNATPTVTPEPPPKKAINLKGVREVLSSKMFGYKKQTIDELLKDMPAGLSEEEMVRYAVMNQQNRQVFMSKRIPVAEVPAVIKEVKAQHSPEQQQQQQQVVSMKTVPLPAAELPVKPRANEPFINPTTLPKIEPRGPTVDNVVNDKSQSDVATAKIQQNEEADRKKKDAANKKILTELDDIEKKLSTNGLTGLIMKLLSGLPALAWGLLKNILVGIPSLLLKMIKKAFSGLGEKALKFLGLDELGADITGAVGTALEAGTGAAAVGTMAYGLYRNLSGKDQTEIKEGTDDRLGKYGIKLVSNKEGYTEGYEIKGKKYGLNDLPKEYKTIVDAYGEKDQRSFTARSALSEIAEHPQEFKKLEVAPNAKPVANVAKIDQGDKISSASPTIIKQDNRKFITQPNNSEEKPVVIQVRNNENSVSTYTASIFDHPVVAPGAYGM